jgi:two-component sensor histidine kinase
VIGFVSVLSARSSSDEVRAVLAQVAGLLQKYSGAHRALEMPTYSTVIDASCYLRALCQSLRNAKLAYKDIELVFVEYPLQMHSERCWKLGMIVSELITNSARHAFHGRGGIIRVTLSESGSFAQCCVTDNGSSRLPPSPGEGLKIVEALARELGGTIVHRFGAEGAVSILLFRSNSKH